MKIKKWYQILTAVSPSRVAQVWIMVDGATVFRRTREFAESATVEQIRDWFSVIQTEATQYVTFELGSEI